MASRLPLGLRSGSCPSCLRTTLPIRCFTTSTTTHDSTSSEARSAASAAEVKSAIPPESPRFTPGLGSLQPTTVHLPRIRGIMPVPRDILGRKNEAGVPKYQGSNVWDYIQKVAPQAKKIIQPEQHKRTLGIEPVDPRTEWKQRLSAQRKQNLLEGVLEMRTRKAKTNRHEHMRTEKRKARRAQLRAEREARQDEHLTNPTTTVVMQRAAKGPVPDPNREVRVAEMQARVQAIEHRRAADRQAALHTLYMHARNFITTEEQLDAAIENCFGTPDVPKTFALTGVSVWANGEPEGITQKLAAANQTKQKVADAQGFATSAERRIKRIAEELTGGKIR